MSVMSHSVPFESCRYLPLAEPVHCCGTVERGQYVIGGQRCVIDHPNVHSCAFR